LKLRGIQRRSTDFAIVTLDFVQAVDRVIDALASQVELLVDFLARLLGIGLHRREIGEVEDPFVVVRRLAHPARTMPSRSRKTSEQVVGESFLETQIFSSGGRVKMRAARGGVRGGAHSARRRPGAPLDQRVRARGR
jgi:hypothetical protein